MSQDENAAAQIQAKQNEGMTLLVAKKFQEAEAKFREAVTLARANPGPGKGNLICALEGLSRALSGQDKGGDSIKVTQEVLKIQAEEAKKLGSTQGAAAIEGMSKNLGNNLHDYESRYGSFNGSEQRDRDSLVKINMLTAQRAADSYATHHGKYPTKLDVAFQSYFPGGSNDGKRAGRPPVNAITQQPEWPIFVGSGAAPHLNKGSLVYSYSPDGTGFAIYGVGSDGNYLRDTPGKTFVLTGRIPGY